METYMRALLKVWKDKRKLLKRLARIAQETHQVAQEIHEGQREISKTLQAMYDTN